MALQYNECCVNNNIHELLTLVKMIPHAYEIEFDILKVLNYDLGMLSVYDYIYSFFKEGVLFRKSDLTYKEDEYEVEYLLESAVHIMEMLINDERYVDFTSLTMAVTIIRIACEMNSILFDSNIFQQVHNINFNKVNYVQCFFVIKAILPYVIREHNNNNNDAITYKCINNNTYKHSSIKTWNNKQSPYIKYSVSPDMQSSSTIDSIYSSQ